MHKRYIVLDLNVLRKDALWQLLTENPEVRCVLPDLAFLEMTKMDQWELTLRRSLQILSQFPTRVHACISINEALSVELKSLEPVTSHMLFSDATSFIRDILLSLRNEEEGWAFRRIRQNPEGHLQDLARDHLDHDANKQRLTSLIAATRKMVPEELQKRLRQGKVNREDRINLALETGKSLMPAMFSSYGVSNGKARAFMHKKPMIYRYLLLNALRGLSWMEKGGSDSFPPTAATNEEIDNHYILSATAFHGLLTEEKSMNSAYQDLLQMLRK